MKKFTFAAVAAVIAIMATSCGNGAPKADLRNDIDTMSYAIGMAQTQGLKEYLVNSLGVDTAYMSEFIKGLNEGVNAGENKKKGAYFAGIQIGQQISNRMVTGINHEVFGDDSTKTISLKNFMSGFISGTTGKRGLMTVEEAQELAQTKMQQIKAAQLEKTYGENKKAGEKFLAENAKKEGVKMLANGIQYKVLKEGTGAIPADTSMVKVHYEGRLINDTIFDSSYKGGELAKVIKGWTEALCHMPEGSVWEVYIPQDQAYAERQQRGIDPFSTLIFKIELIESNAKRK